MMASARNVGIVWKTPPDQLARAIEQYGDKVLHAVAAVAQFVATKMQNAAKQNAPWTDRTGNARSGLFGTSEAEFAKHVVTIYLSHGVLIDYGVNLELNNGGRYAIIMRTMEAHLPEVKRMLDGIFQ